MKRILLPLLLAVCGIASAQTTTITASNIADVGGNPVTGQFCVQPAEQFVRGGGGGNVVPTQVCYTVTAGVLQSGANVADVSLGNPANVCYIVKILNSYSEPVANYPCMQPSGSTYSFDTFVQAAAPYIPTGFTVPLFSYNGTQVPIQNALNFAGPGVSYADGTWTFSGGGGGGSSITWIGAWSSTTAYAVDSAVSYQGSSYLAVAANTNVVPGTNFNDWVLIAQVGAAGTAGATGPQGPQGIAGAAGANGAQGEPGETGAAGPTGPTGATGSAGASATVAVGTVTTGAANSSAAVSNAGTSSAAVFDFTIPQGIQGATGATGAQGIQGNAGATGSTGPAGTAATIGVGTVAGLAAGATPTVTNSGSSSVAVFNFGIPAGVPGATGATGATGNTGATGATGAAGSAATIAVGTVSTGSPGSNATVNNSGSSSAATLNFSIPQGATGNTGATGATGAAGPNTVSTSTTTALSGILKGNGSNVALATSGTDYVIPSGNVATASNLSGTPALPNGVTATTQTTGDNTAKLATDAFVLANGGGSSLPTATAAGQAPVSTGAGTTYTAQAVALASQLFPTAQVEHIFASAGTFNYAHNLSDEYPTYNCYSLGGATAYSAAPVDANNMAITVPASATVLCSFSATKQISDFAFTVTPSTYTYTPTMAGTQTPTFSIAQTAIGSYSGTVTYSTTGLASGMSSGYGPSTITGTGSSTLSVSFPSTQTSGLTTITTSGTDGTLTHTNPLALTISDINSGLLDGWQMNEGSGTTFNDATSNANQQTFSAGIGSWGTVSGFTGSAYTFNGSGYATGSNHTLTNFDGTAAFTISFWCNLSSSSGDEALVQDWATGPIGWSVNSFGGDLNFTFETSTAGLGSHTWSTAITGGLHYIAITYSPPLSGATIYVYVDGVQQSVFNPSSKTGTLASGQPVTIGGSPTTVIGGTTYTPTSGTIGYVRIYSGAKTSAQISAYYAAGPR